MATASLISQADYEEKPVVERAVDNSYRCLGEEGAQKLSNMFSDQENSIIVVSETEKKQKYELLLGGC